MRNLHSLDHYRLTSDAIIRHWGWIGDGTCGAFILPSPIDRAPIKVIASAADHWDHVSVSRKNRCPNWAEMDFIKRQFFTDDETAMQLHVPVSAHISNHPYCLHLWRPWHPPIPLPPADFVGVQTKGDMTGASHAELIAAQREAIAQRPASIGGGSIHDLR